MRIVIEVDGQKVTAIGPDAAPIASTAPERTTGDPAPGPAPAELLARAKKLGALSAGAAQFGRGAALHSAETSTAPAASPAPARPAGARRPATKRRARRSR